MSTPIAGDTTALNAAVGINRLPCPVHHPPSPADIPTQLQGFGRYEVTRWDRIS